MNELRHIVFEGIDYMGKSTLATRIADLLAKDGVNTTIASLGGGRELTSKSVAGAGVHNEVEALRKIVRFTKCPIKRKEAWKELWEYVMAAVISKEDMEYGEPRVILWDRATASTFAYSLEPDPKKRIPSHLEVFFQSRIDKWVYFEPDIDLMNKRRVESGCEIDVIESQGDEFYAGVVSRYEDFFTRWGLGDYVLRLDPKGDLLENIDKTKKECYKWLLNREI